RWLEVEAFAESHAFGDLAEELLDGADSNRLEHRLAVAVGEREVAHSEATSALYAAASMRASASEASPRRIRTSQPSPFGSSFTVCGASTALRLTALTTPDSGAIRSETALTDSTSP